MEPKRPDIRKLIRDWIAANLRLFHESQQPTLWLLAPLIGLATGAAAVLFRLGIGLVQWPWLHDMSENVAAAAREQPWWVILLAPAVGGLLVGLMLHYLLASHRAGSVPEVIEARIASGRGLGLRQGLASAAVSILSLGSGASAGREGPVVHLGASLAASVCARLNLDDVARRTLLACGVAGAVSSSFNAPIAGVLFAQEVILAHFAARSFVPLVVASSAATLVSRAWFGNVAAFIVPNSQVTSSWEIPAFVLLGITAAVVAILFQVALISTERVAHNIRMPLIVRPVIGGLAVGVIALALPQVLGVGYEATDQALKDELGLTLMLALIVAKTAATAITLASRFGGGIFSPTLYLGAMTGGAFGLIAASVFPEVASSEGLYAILGMGAVAAAVLGAPISTTVMVFELTGGYALSMALLLTVAIANGLSLAVLGRSYFQAVLEQRGIFISEGAHRVLVTRIHVADLMEESGAEDPTMRGPDDSGRTLFPGDTLATALAAFDASRAGRLPVVDRSDPTRIVGWVRRVTALERFNQQLIAASREEHR